MKIPNLDLRSSWVVSRLLISAALAAGCGTTSAPTPTSLEVEDTSEALSEDELDCERTKRECLIAANCEADPREACEEAFRACEEPARAEKKKVHDACRAEREACDEQATDDAGRHACHMAEHKCNASVEPPEAQCHVDAEECVWTARGGAAPTMPPSDAEEACRAKERACREMLKMGPEDLPKPPKCAPPPPPACEADGGVDEAPAEPPAPPAPLPVDDGCERTKRECLIAADCDKDKNEACETAFRTCEEPVRAERDKVREQCKTARETCEAAATDEEGRHSCHIAEHECKLPIEPPEAVCRIEAEKCLWAAKEAAEPPVMSDPPTPHEPSAAEEACRETERTCREANKEPKEDLPKPPMCGPKPGKCGPKGPGHGPGPGEPPAPPAGDHPKPPAPPEPPAP